MESQADGLKKMNSKRPLIAGGVTLVLALVAGSFFLGKKFSKPVASPSPHASETHAPSEHREPAHEGGHKEAPSDDHEMVEEEVEIEFAKHGKPKKSESVSPISEAHADDHAAPKKVHHESKDTHAAPSDPHAAAPVEKKSIVQRYVDAWASFQNKVEAVRQADEAAKRLTQENAYLRMMLETSKFSCRKSEQAEKSQAAAKRLKHETGAQVGRTLAAIKYQIPENLLPEQLHALAVSYFKQKDDEKAVTLFTFLTELENDHIYRSAENFLMTAISWYRLENYAKAESYLDRVLLAPVGKERERHLIQAKLWKALVAKRLAQNDVSQKWLKKTLEVHPHSREVRWINPQEGDREVASKRKENDVSETKPSEHEAPASPAQHPHH